MKNQCNQGDHTAERSTNAKIKCPSGSREVISTCMTQPSTARMLLTIGPYQCGGRGWADGGPPGEAAPCQRTSPECREQWVEAEAGGPRPGSTAGNTWPSVLASNVRRVQLSSLACWSLCPCTGCGHDQVTLVSSLATSGPAGLP